MKEVVQEVHVEVEVEKINYVNQLVEKEGASCSFACQSQMY